MSLDKESNCVKYTQEKLLISLYGTILGIYSIHLIDFLINATKVEDDHTQSGKIPLVYMIRTSVCYPFDITIHTYITFIMDFVS